MLSSFSGETILLFYILCSVLSAAAIFAIFHPWRFGTYAKPVFLTVFSIIYFIASVTIPAFSPERFQDVSRDALHGFTILILVIPFALYYVWSRREEGRHQTTWPRLDRALSVVGGICLGIAAFFFVLTMIADQVQKADQVAVNSFSKIALMLLGILTLAPLFLGLASMFAPKESFHQLFSGGRIKRSWVIGYLVACIVLLIIVGIGQWILK